MKALAKACEVCVEELIPTRAGGISGGGSLGASSQQTTWLKYEIDPQAATPNLWFRYSFVLPQAGGYIAKQVAGTGSPDRPATHREPCDQAHAGGCGRRCLQRFPGPYRASNWRGPSGEGHHPSRGIPSACIPTDAGSLCAPLRRYGVLLAASKSCQGPGPVDLLQDVLRHKSRFFALAWASYDTAAPGTHLVPPEPRHAELTRDLAAMEPMFLSDPPSFSELLRQLSIAEEELNQ